MSKYYSINGLKVRVSDHEPNHAMNKFRGESDVEFYTKSIDNRTLSIESQVYGYCDKHDLDMSLFADVLADFPDAKPIFVEKTKSTTQVITQEFLNAYNAIGKKKQFSRRCDLCNANGIDWQEMRTKNYIIK
jgi:predicted methyltransferase